MVMRFFLFRALPSIYAAAKITIILSNVKLKPDICSTGIKQNFICSGSIVDKMDTNLNKQQSRKSNVAAKTT